MLELKDLRPLQALAAAVFFKHRRLLLSLPRQYGGKTELGVRIGCDLLGREVNGTYTKSALFLAKDKKSGKKATREKFERIYDKRLFHVNTENVYLKKHPSACLFMDSVDKDPDRIRGGTYSYIHWSEVAFSKIEKGESIISVFDKVVQPTLRLTKGYCLLESTNNGKNGWWELWERGPDYGFARLKVALSDMVYMGLVSREDYDEIQRTTHPDVFRQEYECEWVTFQGKVYAEFDEARHVADIPGPEEWQAVVSSIDWGYNDATCVLFAYVKDGVLCIFDEHYATGELAAVTADQIAFKRDQWRIAQNRLACVADHEPDRIEELNRRGIACGNASKANMLGARIEIKELLYFDKIRIHPRCKWLLKDLDAAVWDEKKAIQGEIDYKQCSWGHMDAEAALRYLVRELSQMENQQPIQNPHVGDPASRAAFDIERRRDADGHL